MRHQPSLMDQLPTSVQSRINRIIPQRVHDPIIVTIKQMVRGVLFSATYTVPKAPVFASLYDLEEAVDFYRKTAAAGGGITGAGGILWSFADFPILPGRKLLAW